MKIADKNVDSGLGGIISSGYFKLGILVLILFFCVSWYVGAYNSLITKGQDVDAKWQQVEVQYQRRMDLIPNLVGTVKGYAAYEEEVLTKVTEMRSKWQGAATPEEKIGAAGEFEGALGRLLVVMENYPDLKANQNFIALQDELANTENKISVERQRYNEAVKNFNTAIAKIPTNFVASSMGLKARTYFEAKAGAEEAVDVKF